jgi:hypothetical protein
MVKKSKKNSPETVEFSYFLEKMLVTAFSYKLPSKKPDSFEINYTINPIITSSVELETVYIRIKLIGQLLGIHNNVALSEEVVTLETLFMYKIKELKNYIITKDDKDVFDEKYQPILAMLTGIGVSTTRGILYEKVHGTLYDDKILPVIDPNIFFKKIDKHNLSDTNDI